MASKIGRLTALRVSRETKPGTYGDGGGLYLVVTHTGTKNFIFRYMVDGKSHWMGLGATHTTDLAEARQKARAARQKLRDGIDPLAARHAAKAAAASAMTFSEVAELYVSAQSAGWSDDNKRQWTNSLRDHVLPVIGAVPITAIDTGAVMRVLEPMWLKKTETASRVRARVEAVLDYGTTRGWRSGDNPARWKGHLKNLLPARHAVQPVEHHAAMPFDDLPAFMSQLAQRQGVAAKCLRLLILTGTRSGEARGARVGEFDLARGVWEIPGRRMKARQPHRIPLSKESLAIVRAQIPEGAGPDTLVFPGAADPTKCLFDTSLAKLVPLGFTVHGFRSSFRDWAGERTSYARETIEQALAHQIGDQAERAYARGDQFTKRTALMGAWADFCLATEQPVAIFPAAA